MVPLISWRTFAGGCWPTPPQRLLLRAALLPEAAADAAWTEWRRAVNLGSLDVASREVLPLLHANLARCGARDDALRSFGQLRRSTWLRNQSLFAAGDAALASLGASNIPAIALKGFALVRSTYADAGVRPMADIDLLIHREDASRAAECLQENGWAPRESLENARVFVDSSRREIDLHTHCLLDSPAPDADRGFWLRHRSIPHQGGHHPVLSPSDQLLHVLLHGVEWTWRNEPSLLWLADAATIVSDGSDRVDWDALLREAQTRRATCTVRHALDYLVRELGATVPTDVLDALRRQRVGPSDRLYCWGKRVGVRGLFGSLPAAYVTHERRARMTGRRARWTSFGDTLRRHLSLDTTSRMPLELARKAVRRARAMVRG